MHHVSPMARTEPPAPGFDARQALAFYEEELKRITRELARESSHTRRTRLLICKRYAERRLATLRGAR